MTLKGLHFSPKERPGWRLSRAATIVLIALILTSVAPYAIVKHMVQTQDKQELQQNVYAASVQIGGIFNQVRQTQRAVLQNVQPGNVSGTFQQATARLIASGNTLAAVLIDTKTSPPQVTEINGKSTQVAKGPLTNGTLVEAIKRLTPAQPFASTGMLGGGNNRIIGYILGPPDAPSGTVMYVESVLPSAFDPSIASILFGTQRDVDFALYFSGRQDTNSLLSSTTQNVPLQGSRVDAKAVQIGSSSFLLVAHAKHPLSDSLSRMLPWILLAAGLMLSCLIAATVEVISRRRDYALIIADKRTKELRESQEKLVQQERLAAIGELASTVGHELRNPLGVVTNALYLLRTSIGEAMDERAGRHLRMAEREVGAATLIVSDLLDFARERQPMTTRVDLRDLIQETLSVVPPPEGIECEVVIETDVPDVSADRDQLRQVFLNLVTNAYEAMPEGGRVTLETHQTTDSVTTMVTDSGIGMDDEVRAHLFDPFYTQKMRGVGLGLTVTKRIVEAHNGVIDVRSEQGAGTSFSVTLPSLATSSSGNPA